MFNTYTNSVQWPIRSYYDYCSLLPHRSETYQFSQPSSKYCCASSRSYCCCCYSAPRSSSFVKPKVTINTGFVLYGLRQSTLIQWPSFRRRFLVGEIDGKCCESVVGRRNRRLSGRSCTDDVDAMISFLSDEIIDEERSWNVVSRVEVRKKVRCDGDVIKGNVRKVKVEGRDSGGNGKLKRPVGFVKQEYKRNGVKEDVKLEEKYDCEHCGRSKKDSQLESDFRRGSKLVTDDSVGTSYKRKEDLRRTKGSSGSSYYSVASSEEFESETEDQDEVVEFHRERVRNSGKKVVDQSTQGMKVSQIRSRRKIEKIDQDEDVEFRRESVRSSGKKVVEQSLKSRKEAAQNLSRRKREDSSNGVGSSYRTQVFEEEEENSNQAVNLNRRRRKQSSQTGVRVSESTGNYEEDMEIHEIHVNDAETNSQNQRLYGKKDTRILSVRNDSERENTTLSQQQLKESSVSRYSSEERLSETQRRTKFSSNQEEGINLRQSFTEGTNNQQSLVDERTSNQVGMRMSTKRLAENSVRNDSRRENTALSQQQLKESSVSHYSSEERLSETQRRTKFSSSQEEGINVRQNFTEGTSNQQSLVDERISNQTGMKMSTERFSQNSEINDIRNTYVSLSNNQIINQEGRQQDYYVEQNPSRKMQSDRTSVSVSQSSDSVKFTEMKRKTDERLIGQQSTTVVELDTKAGKSDALENFRINNANSRKEDQSVPRLQSSQGKLFEEASSSQSSLNLVSGTRKQLVDIVLEEIHESQTTMIPPSSQLVSRAGRPSIQEISSGTSESAYPTRADSSVDRQSTEELTRFTTNEDALGSAHRLEQSSQKFIGEFVKRASHEVSSTPETVEQRFEGDQLIRKDSQQTSGGSGAKGPSDELWVTDSAQGTPQPGATEGTSAEGNLVFKKTGRSLWNVIADIARLRWGSRAGSPDSIAKPAGKSSSNESVSSAAWFSGREHDGSSEDNTKGDRVSPQEAVSPLQLESSSQTPSRSQSDSSGATKLNQQPGRHEGAVTSIASTILEGGSASNRISSATDFEFRLSETEVPMKLPSRSLKRSPAVHEPSEPSPTGVSSGQVVTVGEGRHYQVRVPEMDKPLVFPDQNLRPPVVKEPGSSSLTEQVEQLQQQQPLSAKSQEETGSGLIQRKLQRNKQVVRDSFEEWEEAYRVEGERRTVDEIFMREALVEAKKAADMWEVPVGAVLVHDGKIIARGFNLVEDLRDSTAHAEIICIREGSKVLHSWRLADTTLYVTLEPCPMCAGAILQARVKTLVWGAPNKLLGADGSWIRLFPGGEGNGSEVSEKPPPPVHPFHPNMIIRRGVLESECAEIMQQFFQLRRKKKDKNSDPTASSDHHHHHHHHHPSKILNKMHQILPFFCV